MILIDTVVLSELRKRRPSAVYRALDVGFRLANLQATRRPRQVRPVSPQLTSFAGTPTAVHPAGTS